MPSASYTVEQYLADIRAIRNTGSATAETSYYPPLDRLFNAAGATLKPKILFSTQLRSQGAGMPDGGFFPQPRRSPRNSEPPPLTNPERGVVEIKPADYDLDTLTNESQTLRYLRQYGLVLITNLREFRLLEHNPNGPPQTRERYILARTSDDLWYRSADPKHQDLLLDFLRRVMLYKVPLTQPKEVAWLLASYAREARARADDHDLPVFRNVKTALEESLGIQFEGEKGEHFFRSTLVQTLFYGIFSAWVLWRNSPEGRLADAHFNWRLSDDFLKVPILRKLFREVSDRSHLNSIQLTEILELAGEALNRVQPQLFDIFQGEEAVAYFYEPFLEAFDPELRKELGVWYTPKEIVHYMVERVDQLLRTELNQPLGLASPAVRILDPCCGTGAYLTSVLNRIHRTLKEQAGDDAAYVASDLRNAALTRVFGFEIMPAPFVIAHMEIARLLEDAEAPLTDTQRAGVFLTNALTGWVPVRHPQAVMYPELEQEREDSEQIKQHGTILVILGNPPYNGYAGIAKIEEERDLTNSYRAPISGLPAPQGQGLNDLYIRFFRIAERRIAANADGQGIVSFISNNAWLDGLSHTTMRHHYLHTFQQIFIDNLNGDKYRTGKTTPDGKPDPSAFSTPQNREGIQVGTAIATLVRTPTAATAPLVPNAEIAAGPLARPATSVAPLVNVATGPSAKGATTYQPGPKAQVPAPENPRAESPTHSMPTAENSIVHLRDIWGTTKLSQLEGESRREAEPAYVKLTQAPTLGNPFAHRVHSIDYTSWPRLPEVFPFSFPGIKTSRDPLVVDIDRDRLELRMKKYFDKNVTHTEMSALLPSEMEDGYMYRAVTTREILQDRGFRSWEIIKFAYRPFDVRWLYWEPETSLLRRKVEEYVGQAISPTPTIVSQQIGRGQATAPLFIREIGCIDLLDRSASCFPIEVLDPPSSLIQNNVPRSNIGPAVRLSTERLGVTPRTLFFHAISIMHTPQYRTENSGALLGDWPRIPLAATAELFTHSAGLGYRLAELLDAESSLSLAAEWSFLAALKLPPHANLEVALKLTAGWGSRGQGSTVMPGRGKLTERPWTLAEREKLAILEAFQSLTLEQATALLGETCVDVYLNGDTFWSAVPINVWNYTLGGYQVLKKWLSYREIPLLGRPLHDEEAKYFAQVVRRIAAILLLGPALDASYQAILPTAAGLPAA